MGNNEEMTSVSLKEVIKVYASVKFWGCRLEDFHVTVRQIRKA
jgi:hypothetical protein